MGASLQYNEALFSFCQIIYTIVNMQTYITENFKQTQKLGEILAQEITASQRLSLKGAKRISEAEPRSAFVVCMEGDLGAGKTTFTQGLLKGLKVKGPYTSPTFVVMKEYRLQTTNYKLQTVYHIDAYRINEKDLQNLGWEELIAEPKNIIIVEWSERVKKILPKNSLKIKFEWVDENKRKISFE